MTTKKKALLIAVLATVALAVIASLIITQVIFPAREYKKLEEKYAVGSYVTFGVYPQTEAGTDNTPIEWMVLAKDGNQVLLLSRYGLDAKGYHSSERDVTWETCSLRSWLNSTFINRAFSGEEQKGILLTDVSNAPNQGNANWSTDGGRDTQDRIFLLSAAEVNQYFGLDYDVWPEDTKAYMEPTAYARGKGALVSNSILTEDGKPTGLWWLRSPGEEQGFASYVMCDGGLGSAFVGESKERILWCCVRPAMWIDLSSGVFAP